MVSLLGLNNRDAAVCKAQNMQTKKPARTWKGKYDGAHNQTNRHKKAIVSKQVAFFIKHTGTGAATMETAAAQGPAVRFGTSAPATAPK